ncbi:MAG: leucine-rich repeat domain-containing protein, partial [Coriobacteriales bacterium]|nr:leucine-rich repeat domain-containing protein [Coriobacteriales bacterium]
MRQIISASITSSKKAGVALRLLLAATLALSSLFIAAPAWADEAEQEGEGSASVWFPEALPLEDSLGQEGDEVASEQESAEGASFAPQSFDPLETIGGTCGAEGSNLTWSLDLATGTLTISGTGAMANWMGLNGYAPWHDYQDLISSVTISEGVTSIGNSAFSGCTSLVSITIPASVATIGSVVFQNCTALVSIAIPASVSSIERDAFSGCTSLASISVDPGN